MIVSAGSIEFSVQSSERNLTLFYTSKFYDRDYERTSKSAAAVVPHLVSVMGEAPKSVIDIGCGRGVWLEAFSKAGVAEIAGRDGVWVKTEQLLISPVDFQAVDLTQPLAKQGEFDLAMSLEVAEHLESEHADTFVDSLTAQAPTILFSAAIKGQGGQHHVNEQNLTYWTERFAARGFDLYDVIRPHMWENEDVCWWYRQNMVVFASVGSPYREKLEAAHRERPPIINLAHPVGFAKKGRLAQIFAPEEVIGLWTTRARRKFEEIVGKS